MTTTTTAVPAGTASTDTHHHPEETGSGGQGLVEISDVWKSYGAVQVLKDISLTVHPGEVISLIGPSGSGKSTLLRAINHLETVDRGSVTVDGQYIGYERRGDRLYELPEREVLRRRTQVGIVFQNFNLFPNLTVLDNITIAPISLKRVDKADAEREARELLERVGLGDKGDRFPRQLSGGQQQRVAIARALALHPKVLLFDEPTSALDPELVGEVLEVIKGLADLGRTLIIVTHEIGFAREISDRVVFLEDGSIVEQGTPDEVIINPRNPRTRAFVERVL